MPTTWRCSARCSTPTWSGWSTRSSRFSPRCKPRGQGALVGIASVAGFRGLPGSGAYSASKAAAIAYLESLRVEQRGTGVAVLTVCPGYVATPMTERNPYPMPFLLDADEAARRIVRAIDRRKRFYVLPWQMAIGGWLLRILPRPIYDALLARAPRKPRQPAEQQHLAGRSNGSTERRAAPRRPFACAVARYSDVRTPTVMAQ